MAAALTAMACSPADPPTAVEQVPAPARQQATAVRPRIVVLGDSLTAGFGLETAQSFPSLLQRRLDTARHEFEVVNAGVSGDTTAGGLRRLDWSIQGDTRVLIVALGGNDGLRGLPVAETRRNLNEIITRAKQRGITVVIAGMEAPPNYGPQYTSDFRRLFRDLAAEHGVAFIPFLLDGVAGNPSLNQRDGIHPNSEGARIVESLVWNAIEPIVTGSTGQ